MLDIDFIRDNVKRVRQAAIQKGFDVDLERLVQLDDRRRELIQESESIRQRRNEVADEIPQADDDERPELIEEGRELKDRLQDVEEELDEVQDEWRTLMKAVPNVPLDEVPVGTEEEDNETIRRHLDPPDFDFDPLDHEQLGEQLGLIDKERAIKFAGSRSYLLTNEGAMLQMAVMRMAMDMLIEDGFDPVVGPVLVNETALEGSGWFPYGREDSYHIEQDDKWLVGTSEVYLVSTRADEILPNEELPVTMCAKSPCFRREAGSAGADTRGVYRVHQFTKAEQLVICEPDEETSREFHRRLLGNAEELMKRLELPHRVAVACTGETGQGQVLKHEIETWMPSRDAYCETHSCSSLYDFQARRSNIRTRNEEGGTEYCYTLNNTMAASPRILIPLLENHQNADGTVDIPEALQPYMRGTEKLDGDG